MHVRFVDAGAWTLTGGDIDFGGAWPDATDRRIFFGAGTVSGLGAARPEWFGDAVGDRYPAIALRRAYAATQSGAMILLSDAAYNSPFFDPTASSPCAGATLSFDSPRLLAGVRRPVPDSLTAPTRLVSGSILRGEVCGTGAFRAAHLGVDEGPFVVAHEFTGHTGYGIQLVSHPLGRVTGTRLEDVSVLTNGMETQHSVIVQGQRGLLISGLWIWTLGGTHGLVIKSLDSHVANFHCTGASADCLIVKADYATDHDGDGSGSRINGVFISALDNAGDTGGVTLDARWDSLHDVLIENVHESGTRSGVEAADSFLHRFRRVTLRNWTITAAPLPCVSLEGGKVITLENVTCNGEPSSASGRVHHTATTHCIKPYLRILWMQCGTVINDGTARERASLALLGLSLAASIALIEGLASGKNRQSDLAAPLTPASSPSHPATPIKSRADHSDPAWKACLAARSIR